MAQLTCPIAVGKEGSDERIEESDDDGCYGNSDLPSKDEFAAWVKLTLYDIRKKVFDGSHFPLKENVGYLQQCNTYASNLNNIENISFQESGQRELLCDVTEKM